MMDMDPAEFTGKMAGHVDPNQDQFERLVDTCLFAARNTFVMHQGLPVPIVVVADQDSVWPLASPGGPLGEWLTWVRQEMDSRNATMFFIATQTQVGWTHHDDFIDATDSAGVDEMYSQDAMGPGMFFYAATRSGDSFIRRYGQARFGDEDLGPIVLSPVDQPIALFDSVMA